MMTDNAVNVTDGHGDIIETVTEKVRDGVDDSDDVHGHGGVSVRVRDAVNDRESVTFAVQEAVLDFEGVRVRDRLRYEYLSCR
jgi:hypothetical protein